MDAQQRYTIAEAAALADRSADTIRRRYRAGELPGAGPDAGDRTGTIRIPACALVGAGLITEQLLAAGESEAIIARRAAERDRDAQHHETDALRVELAAARARMEVLETQLAHANKLTAKLAGALESGRAA